MATAPAIYRNNHAEHDPIALKREASLITEFAVNGFKRRAEIAAGTIEAGPGEYEILTLLVKYACQQSHRLRGEASKLEG